MPKHVGLIPDGNRRWAKERGMHPREGYVQGVLKGIEMLDSCLAMGIDEVSVYGFTTDNNKRPKDQRVAFGRACTAFAQEALKRDVDLLILGDSRSPMFPPELLPFSAGRMGGGRLKVNMLVNYGWNWDLQTALCAAVERGCDKPVSSLIASNEVSRIDLIVRWGGGRRLSGFLPVQSVYADFYVVDQYWPDFDREQFDEALRWYSKQDVTLGG